MNRIFVSVLAILFLVSGCIAPASDNTQSANSVQGAGTMVIYEAWMRPASQQTDGAVYFVILNLAAEYDELLRVFSEVAEAVEIHVSRWSGDVMSMHPTQFVPLTAGEEITFAPGGLHIMLVGLKQDLKVGDELTVTLQFKKHKPVIIKVPVQETHSDHTEEALQRLRSARQKWQNAKISHYRFRLNFECICLVSQYAPLIEVQNGEIVSMKIAEGSDIEEFSLQEVRDLGTIDKLFDFVEGTLRGGGGDIFSVKFEETYGFPSYYWDSNIETVDDESRIFVSDFEILR